MTHLFVNFTSQTLFVLKTRPNINQRIMNFKYNPLYNARLAHQGITSLKIFYSFFVIRDPWDSCYRIKTKILLINLFLALIFFIWSCHIRKKKCFLTNLQTYFDGLNFLMMKQCFLVVAYLWKHDFGFVVYIRWANSVSENTEEQHCIFPR